MVLYAVFCAVVALTGSRDSALVAYLVASVFEDQAVACIHKSATISVSKLQRARYTADLIGKLFYALAASTHLS